MTTTTPAMPELPEPELGYIKTDKSNQPAFSARQMREALSPQQSTQGDTPSPEQAAVIANAQVSDEDLRKAVDALRDPDTVSAFYNGYFTLTPDELRRAILALRPAQQAVPMTDEQIRSMCKQGWVFETVKQWVRIIEAHHDITAQGAQGGV